MKYRVLVVDDEPAVTEDLCMSVVWSDFGFHMPDVAFDGKEALKMMNENKYHLIITDIRMPGISGLELLKEIYNSGPEIKMLILSGYSEFSYASKAIQYGVKAYLLKPVDRFELASHLKKIRAELDKENNNKTENLEKQAKAREHFLYRLVCGIESEEDIKRYAAEFDLILKDALYCVALCEIQDFYDMLAADVKKARHLKASVRKSVEKILLEKRLKGYVYEDIEAKLGIILCFNSNSFFCEKLEDIYKQICCEIKNEFKVNLIIGYGDPVDDVKDLRISRKNALYALERTFVTEGACVVSYQKVNICENKVLLINWNSQSLLNAVECYDTEQIRRQIDIFISELAEKTPPKDGVSYLVFSIIFSLCSLIKRRGGVPEKMFNYTKIKSMLEMPLSLEKLNSWMFSVCQQTASYIATLFGDEKMHRLMGQVKKYIDDNFEKDITVKKLSDMFYISPGYLGQLFKNAVGETISKYVNKKKIAEIKRIIGSENTNVYEALARVGYNNASYFYKKFRELEGISFADYKKKIQKE